MNDIGDALDYAADEIDKLRAEIALLKRAYEWSRKDCINLTEKVIPNLRAENAALVNAARLLPLVATPAINRRKAEGMREAADFVRLVGMDWEEAGATEKRFACDYLFSCLQDKADELEGKK